jgi:hypothetical protein
MALLPIFALSFSSSIFNINSVLLSTTEHFKISGSCFYISIVALIMLPFIIFTYSFIVVRSLKRWKWAGPVWTSERPCLYLYIFYQTHTLFWSEISFSLLISIFFLMIEVDLGMVAPKINYY